MSSKLVTTIPVYATDDYASFRMLAGNRDLNQEQVKKLTRALEYNNEMTRYNPIKVNEKMEVIDGQHRLAAHKALASEGTVVPIHYMVMDGLTVENARLLNSGQKPWSPENYADMFALLGNRNYKTYLDFRKIYGLNHQILSKYLSPDGGYDMQTFKDGGFVVADMKRSHELCERLSEVGAYLPVYIWKNRGFALSFIDAMLSENYDHDRMLAQMERYGALLEKVALKNSEMLPAINMVFNKGYVVKTHLI